MIRLFCFFSLAIGLSFLTSCGVDNLTTEELLIQEIATASNKVAVDNNELLTPITSDVNLNHFETYIDQAFSVEAKGYEVNLGTETAIYFDTEGTKLMCNKDGKKGRKGKKHWDKGKCGDFELDLIETSEIPQIALDYISTNFPDANVRGAKAFLENDLILKIFVGLDNKKIVVFDELGIFIGFHELIIFPCHADKEELNIADLDASITSYIANNYSSAEVKVAFKITGKEDIERIIVALLQNDNKVVLAFDLSGNFIKELHK